MLRLKDVDAKADEKIYSMDVSNKGAKQFMARTLPSMWSLMQTGKRNYCEIIEDRPCHMYFDLDEGNVRQQWAVLEKMLNAMFFALKDQVGTVQYIFLDASRGKKQSAHIIVMAEKYLLESPVQGRSLYQRLVDIYGDDVPSIDLGVYTRNRCFRMLGNSKYGQDRPLVGLPWTMENWVRTLIQPVRSKEVAKLGLHRVTSAPMRSTLIPPCVEAVLDWAGASDYRWKNDLEWVWTGHLQKGVCKIAGRVHSKNNRCFFFTAPDRFAVWCHHCHKIRNEAIPEELQFEVMKFLNQVIKI
tara:strand:- start:7357 stop:8253 length:897 start_codon:yes stop_codon:yes gene_type:complete